jgi:UDP-glucose 4-epimerase
MAILVTGGAGYIGSHMTLLLLERGYDVVVVDSLINSSCESLRRVEKLSERSVVFVEGDIRDRALLDSIFSSYKISEVLHFAGLKSVGQSVEQPLRYFEYNVSGTLNLCQAMSSAGVRRLVFSSSATVYGNVLTMPIKEEVPTATPTNPYGRSKLMVEEVLKDLVLSDSRWSVALLRYFNPVGAHESGQIGEDPSEIPNNLLPFVSQVAVGRREILSVYGNDYPTPDGTGIRDYVHVMDLVEGHLCAMHTLTSQLGFNIWNLGTGRGYSVLEILKAFEEVSGCNVPYRIVSRRDGDVAESWADPAKAERELGWKAKRGLDVIMKDTWRWQKENPKGYIKGY